MGLTLLGHGYPNCNAYAGWPHVQSDPATNLVETNGSLCNRIDCVHISLVSSYDPEVCQMGMCGATGGLHDLCHE